MNSFDSFTIKFGAISGCTLKIFFVDWTPLKYVVCVLLTSCFGMVWCSYSMHALMVLTRSGHLDRICLRKLVAR